MLSIIIPARNEPHLQRTIDDVIKKSVGKIEVIVILDGYWPSEPIRDDGRVKVIHHNPGRGMRASINAGVSISQGEYIMKLDAHCAMCQKYDTYFGYGEHSNIVIVPIRYRLDVEEWHMKKGQPRRPAQYIERGTLKGKDWHDYSPRFFYNPDKFSPMFPIMTSQGSCWVMSREWWENIGGLDEENYGSMGREAQEVCLKTWLNGGWYMAHEGVWYAHWDKPAEYCIRGKEKEKSIAYAQQYWTEEKLKPLILRFMPVPSWEEKIAEWNGSLALPSVKSISPPKPENKLEYIGELKGTTPIGIGEVGYLNFFLNKHPIKSINQVEKPKNRVHLYKMFNALGFKIGAEIGVWSARNAANMLACIKNLKLYLVDPYINHPYVRKPRTQERIDRNKEQAARRMADKNIEWMYEMSEIAVHNFEDNTLDFVYIDGEHTYDQVMLDLILWSRKVRSGGIISGHDYVNNPKKGVNVKQAVKDFTSFHSDIKVNSTDPKAEKEGRALMPSFWWVKP